MTTSTDKVRPKPARKSKRMSAKQIKSMKSYTANVANNVVARTLNSLKKIKNIAAYKRNGPAPDTHNYGVRSIIETKPEPNANTPIRPKPARKPRKPSARKSSSVSLTTVEPEPSIKNLTPKNVPLNLGFPLAAMKAEAERNVNFFLSALKAKPKKKTLRERRGEEARGVSLNRVVTSAKPKKKTLRERRGEEARGISINRVLTPANKVSQAFENYKRSQKMRFEARDKK